MALDVPDGHSPCVQGDDLGVEAGEPRLPLLDELGLERPPPISRNLDRNGAHLGLEGLGGYAVSSVSNSLSIRRVLLVAEVLSHLGLEGSLDKPRRELLQEAAFTDEVIRVL